MLKHIYDFAVNNNLAADDRYKEKYIRYYIHLDINGKFIDIEENKIKTSKKICPSYPPRKTYGNIANFLVEKGPVIFDAENKKQKNYLEDILNASESVKEFILIYNFITNPLPENLEFLKTTNELVSFRIDSVYMEDIDSWKPYFEDKYKSYINEELEKEKDNEKMISVVSGDIVNPIKIADKISVGGATSGTGDVIICCDKPSYQSYGLDGALNGAISKQESEILKNGLEYLLSNNYNRTWNLIHWYDKDVNLDIVDAVLNPESLFLDGLIEEDENLDKNEKDKKLYDFLKNFSQKGIVIQDTSDLVGINYYLLNFKPCNGRIAFSGFRVGNFDELFNNILSFYKDSEMLKGYFVKENDKFIRKEAFLPILNIYSILLNSLNSGVEGNKRFEQVDKEFSIYKKQQLINAIIYNKQLPIDFFNRAVLKIRKEKMSGENPPFVLYQILKLYINRDKKMKGESELIMPVLNKDNKDIAYNCGRLLCVYEKIQKDALGDVNASVVDRYYASASASPAYVFGRLSNLAIYHLRKIKNPGKVIYYKKLLQEITSNIDAFPKKLDIYEQANFSLGYYQQEQDFYTKKDIDLNNNEEDNYDE